MTANVQIEVAKKDDVLRVPNDALRFKPRNDPTAAPESQANRGEKQISRLKDELQLTETQEKVLRDDFAKFFAANASTPGGVGAVIADPAAMRQKMQALVEQTLNPLLSEDQRPLLDKWKRGRENTKSGAVHVLTAQNTPERRSVRLGITDDQFTEIVSGQLAEGDRVIVRARDAPK